MPKVSKPTPAPQRFEARLERLRSPLRWTIIRVPFDVGKVWSVRGPIKVKGKINGFAFRSALFPDHEGGHILPINQRLQKSARVAPDSVARFHLELDREERTLTPPDELQSILNHDRPLRLWYDTLNRSTRSQIAQWITEPKSAAARARRAEQIAERLLNVLEAERDLPPILHLAFSRHPRARLGWDRMSLACRRAHLLALYYYRTPDAQARRIDKMLEDAAARAKKIGAKKNAGIAPRQP